MLTECTVCSGPLASLVEHAAGVCRTCGIDDRVVFDTDDRVR